MKKLRSVICFTSLLFSSLNFAQSTDTLVNVKKNVISTDLSPLLKSYFNFSQNGLIYSNYLYDPYILMYRRLLNQKNVLRIGVGFDSYSTTGVKNDSLESKTQQSKINIGLGYERQITLGKRSLIYTGTDLTYAASLYLSQYPFSSTGYYEDKENANKYGLTPFIGYSFFITKRLSVATEASLLFYYERRSTERRNHPDNGNATISNSNTFYYSFNPPTSIQIRFHF